MRRRGASSAPPRRAGRAPAPDRAAGTASRYFTWADEQQRRGQSVVLPEMPQRAAGGGAMPGTGGAGTRAKRPWRRRLVARLRHLRLHGKRRFAELFGRGIVRRDSKNGVDIGERARIITLGAVELGAREKAPRFVLRSARRRGKNRRARDRRHPCGARPGRASNSPVGTFDVDGERRVKIFQRGIELAGFEIGAAAPDIGKRYILACGDGVVEIGDRLLPNSSAADRDRRASPAPRCSSARAPARDRNRPARRRDCPCDCWTTAPHQQRADRSWHRA